MVFKDACLNIIFAEFFPFLTKQKSNDVKLQTRQLSDWGLSELGRYHAWKHWEFLPRARGGHHHHLCGIVFFSGVVLTFFGQKSKKNRTYRTCIKGSCLSGWCINAFPNAWYCLIQTNRRVNSWDVWRRIHNGKHFQYQLVPDLVH